MGLDLIRKGRQSFPRSQTGSGATNINNGVIHIDLTKTWLMEKITVLVSVTQAFTGAPTSYDVRRFFTQMQLLVDSGAGQKANFYQAYDFFRLLNPQAPAPVVSLGANSTAQFIFEVNFAQLMALGSLSTSLLSGKYSTLALELTINADASNGFIGGTSPGVATYSVEIMPWEMRDQTPVVRSDTSSGWGIAERVLKQLQNWAVTSGGGLSQDVLLTAGNKTRFISLHCFDAATQGNPTDAIINNGGRITMEVDGFKYYENTLLSSIKLANIQKRNMPATGMLLLDFGDDPRQWLETRGLKDVKFNLAIPASANLPANGRIEVCQDYTTGLEKLKGPLAA